MTAKKWKRLICWLWGHDMYCDFQELSVRCDRCKRLLWKHGEGS